MKYIFSFLFLLNLFSGSAQSLVPYRKGDQWGFSDRQKKIIIPCIYDSAGFFYGCNRAFVEIKGKFGFVDDTGKLVIAAKYDDGADFKHNYGWACKTRISLNQQVVWIDTNSDTLKQNQYPKGRLGNKAAPGITPTGVVFSQNGKKGFAIPLPPQDQNVGGYDTVLPPIYNQITEIKGAILAQLNGKWGVLNVNNYKTIIPFEYDLLHNWHNTPFIVATKNGLKGVFNKKGELILPTRYKAVQRFIKVKKLFKVETQKNKFGYVGYNGTEYFED